VKILSFDSVGGASGDMILATMISLGADITEVNRQLQTLRIEPFAIEPIPHEDRGIFGLRVAVHVHDHHHPHRHFADIRHLIQSSDIDPVAKAMSIDVFSRLAQAEGKVHNCTPEHVHFHEVGAMDSIIDIVGSCIAHRLLEIEQVYVGTLPVGHGTFEADHGILPIPAPATAELLLGHPIMDGNEPFELVTPTGAAILMTWKNTERPPDGAVIRQTGYGFGTRTLNHRANMLRAFLMETADKDARTDEAVVLECNLDDMVPELIGALTQNLLKTGALDVFTTPIQMKKQRPGTRLTVLSRLADRETLMDLIFTGSTTFGIREYTVRRTLLERQHRTVQTVYGAVRVKIGSWKGRAITHSPEYEDCVQCAARSGVSVRTVYEMVLKT
jgi:uncharacterized protein (TIGR00299 family) protein